MAEFLEKKTHVVEPGEAIELELNKNNEYKDDNEHQFSFSIKYSTIAQPDGEMRGIIWARNRTEAYEKLKGRTFQRLYDPLNMNRTVIEYGCLKEY